MNQKEFIHRRKQLCEMIEDQSFVLLASGEAKHKSLDQHFKYFPERNFYYLTGLKREKFILLLANNQGDCLDYIFIEEPSDYATKWLGRRMTKEEVHLVSGIDTTRIFYLTDFKAFIANRLMLDSRQLILNHVPHTLYLDMYREKPMALPISFNYFKEIVDHYPELNVKNINGYIADMRRIKSKDEVLAIKHAIEHTKKGINGIYHYAKPGINERELEATFDYHIKLSGSSGQSFDTIVASGGNATVLHYVDNNDVINDHELVLLDLGAYHEGYAADISRTFPVNGKFTPRQAELYQMVLDVNIKTIEKIKPGMFVQELNEYAKDLLAEGMMKLKMIKEKSEISKYYYHNVSHYLGLDVHDVGTYSKKIEAGVVLTIEPGIYIEEEKIGIRIEDDILVTETGYINLSEDIIKEIKDIEQFFAK